MVKENLADLQAFVTVAQARSFTRAAAQLGLSRSALSHAMTTMEARLGVRLLSRTTRSVSVTDAGAGSPWNVVDDARRIEATLRPRQASMRRQMRFMIALALGFAGSAVHAQAYRCGNSYSATPCNGGNSGDITPQGSPNGERNSSSTSTVYLCGSYGGGRSWSSAYCNTQSALIERTAPVPSNIPWDQKVAIAQGQRSAAEAEARPPAVVQHQSQPD